MEFIGSPEKWAWLASLAYQPLEQSISNAKIENNTLHSACVMLTRREKGAAAIKTPSLNSLVAVRSIKRLGVDPRCGYRLIVESGSLHSRLGVTKPWSYGWEVCSHCVLTRVEYSGD